jgi:hypothetical protein
MNLNKQLAGQDGLPATQQIAKGYNEDGSPKGIETINITVGHVIRTCLNHVDREKKEQPEIFYKKGKQSYEINCGIIPNEFNTVEGVTEIKELMSETKLFIPLICYQVAQELEENLKTKQ